MRVFSFVLAVALSLPFVAVAQSTLTVSGEGRAVAAPDMAVVTLGVTESAKDADVAMGAVSTAVGGILAGIERAGIAERDVQTTGLSLSPRYSAPPPGHSGPRVDGYQASNSVTVRVRNLDDVGALLGDLVGQGANTLNGLFFDVADPTPLQAEAERLAVADASRRAANLAAAAGLTLGPILSIEEGGAGQSGGPIMRSMAMAESAAVPISGGEVSRAASVVIVYELLD